MHSRTSGVLRPRLAAWRRNDGFRHLPRAEREDLELWLMEQAYQYCVALSERPESRHDWERARNLLDRLAEPNPLPVFTTLAAALSKNSISPGSTVTHVPRHRHPFGTEEFSPGASAPTWSDRVSLGCRCRI